MFRKILVILAFLQSVVVIAAEPTEEIKKRLHDINPPVVNVGELINDLYIGLTVTTHSKRDAGYLAVQSDALAPIFTRDRLNPADLERYANINLKYMYTEYTHCEEPGKFLNYDGWQPIFCYPVILFDNKLTIFKFSPKTGYVGTARISNFLENQERILGEFKEFRKFAKTHPDSDPDFDARSQLIMDELTILRAIIADRKTEQLNFLDRKN